ncbi:putative Transposon TX1 [Gossypium australe]|uniref:Putative Transposon TX1 n=1 Tax=Gossypium australe TaxID=47621 RepID=A0A5B6UW60_9ROSI|nr:putative Transposon TX1 [Gossypium australe]
MGNSLETNIRERLVRGVANTSWLLQFTYASISHVPHSFSGHCPLLIQLGQKEELYWEQRARINWLKVGDKNTKCFHSFASQRKKRNTINCLETEEGRVTRDHSKMAHIAKNFFESLFTSNKGASNSC